MAAPVEIDPRYALDTAWYAERERLESLTRLYDPTTTRILEGIGVGPGWRCLEVGAGTGSIARWLADRIESVEGVGSVDGGSVVALDVDTRFLTPLADATLHVERADIEEQPPARASYDLVHARLVLEHLPRRQHVLASLVDAVRPGGLLLIEDFDWVTAGMTDPPSAVHTRIVAACLEFLTAHGYDPHFGRTLPSALRARGLREVGVCSTSETVTSHPVRGVPQWELLVEQLEPALIARGSVTPADLQEFHDLWHDGRRVAFAPLMISAWGWVSDSHTSGCG